MTKKKPCPECNKLIQKTSNRCCACNSKRFRKPDYVRLEIKRRCARIWSKNRDINLRKQIYAKLGDKCLWCGFDDPRALQIDHVNDDGYKDRNNKFRNWNSYNKYKTILNDTEGRFQILCANCNMIKMQNSTIRREEEKQKRWIEMNGSILKNY